MTKIYSYTVAQNSSEIWMSQEQVLNKRATVFTAQANFSQWVNIHILPYLQQCKITPLQMYTENTVHIVQV